MNRRSMLKAAGSAAAVTILSGIPLNLAGENQTTPVSPKKRKKIIEYGPTFRTERKNMPCLKNGEYLLNFSLHS